MSSIITILIPSVGRPTLSRTLESLLRLNNSKWTAIVGFDGCVPAKPTIDPRINYIYLNKVGGGLNHGGMVRNFLFPLVLTDWMCFLDDDDTFRPNYVDVFVTEIQNNPDADCVVFRMSYDTNDKTVLPPLGLLSPQICQVGISFAVKKSFLIQNNIKFKNSSFEDFFLLQEIEKIGGKIIFSTEIAYNVRF